MNIDGRLLGCFIHNRRAGMRVFKTENVLPVLNDNKKPRFLWKNSREG